MTTALILLVPVLLALTLAPFVLRERPGVRRPLGLPRSHRRHRTRDLYDLAS